MLSFWWKPPKDTNLKPIEQKIQQLEQQIQQLTNNNQTLTQQVQQIANANQQMQQSITTLTNQIQPLLNDWRHVVKANQTNNFQEPQKITANDAGLIFVQSPNKAGFINFQKNDGTRRGYVGMSSSQNDEIGIMGKTGVNLSTQTGDIDLAPAGHINANNNAIKNIADPTSENDAFSWNYLRRRIRRIEGQWRNFSNQKEHTWPNITGGIIEVLNIEAGYGTSPNFKVPVQVYDWVIENNNNTLRFKATGIATIPGVNQNLYVKLTYLTAR